MQRHIVFPLGIGALLGGLIYNWNFHAVYRDGLKLDYNLTNEKDCPGNSPKCLPQQEGFFNYHVFLMMFFYLLPNDFWVQTRL